MTGVEDVTKNYLVTISATGATKIDELTAQPTVDELQRGVGDGHIEIVPGFSHLLGRACVAFCHEEGKLEGQPINRYATALWHAQEPRFIGRDVLVGQICVVVGTPKFLRDL